MKYLNNFFLALSVSLLAFSASAQNRYLDEIFTDVSVQPDVVYGQNYTIITISVTGKPSLQQLKMDVYTPVGDTATDRPVVLYFHTGNFLPNPQNGSTTGSKTDSTVVETCKQLARMGYVAAALTYRQGWNPVSSDINVRVSTLINAAYRGVQDARTCIRFMRKSVAENSNPYGIDPNRIVLWGQGTGGYVTYATATLDQYTDILLPKFIDGNTGIPAVIEQINGDVFGTSLGTFNADTFCLPNHVGYSSDFNLAVNMGGAMGDTSWLDASDVPMISFQVPDDPFAPYKEGILIVPTTGDQIVEVQGAYVVQQKAAALGINKIFSDVTFTDGYTAAADLYNNGWDGLFPLNRPRWPDPTNPNNKLKESSPWDWWNEAYWSNFPHPSCPAGVPVTMCNFNTINKLSNPDMSATKGRIYLDTIMSYYAPRACWALDLPCKALVATQKTLKDSDVQLVLAPNPATQFVEVRSAAAAPIKEVAVFNAQGQLVRIETNINSNFYNIQRDGFPQGVYFAKIRFEQGIITKSFIFAGN